jgi:hypothetical protein
MWRLAHHRGLSATPPRPVRIGGLKGYELSVRVGFANSGRLVFVNESAEEVATV